MNGVYERGSPWTKGIVGEAAQCARFGRVGVDEIRLESTELQSQGLQRAKIPRR